MKQVPPIMPHLDTYTKTVLAFEAMTFNEVRRNMAELETVIGEIMEVTMVAAPEIRGDLARLELRLRAIRRHVMVVEGN